MSATYSIVAASRTPAQLAGPTLVELGPISGNVTYTDHLKEAGTATVTVGTDTLQEDIKTRLRDLATLPLEAWVYRDGVLVFAGPVVSGSIQDSTLTLDIRSIEVYTAYMLITTDQTWTALDVATGVKNLIDDWQALDYGDYGIETAGLPAAGLSRTLKIPGADEPVSVYDFLVTQATNFDWWVDHATRALAVSTGRGSDLSASVFLERGVVSPAIRFSAAPLVIASEVVAIGTGPNLTAPITTTKSNATLRAAFGRSGLAITADPVEDATHLGEVAQAVLDEADETLFIPGPGLMPIVGASVEDFGVGDTVTYTFDAGLGQTTGAYRIVKRTVQVDPSGQETISVEFGAT